MRPAGDWQKESKCREEGNFNDFFTGQGQNPTEARKMCPTCPVQQECLDYALMYDERGVWGGKTEKERNMLPKFIKKNLIQEAKSQGLWENRLSIDSLIAESRRAVVLEFPEPLPEPLPLEQLEPPVELSSEELDPNNQNLDLDYTQIQYPATG